MQNIVNLTPHPLVIEGYGVIEPSGVVPRAQQTEKDCEEINGIPVIEMSFGAVENMPTPEEGTVFVVSAITAQALKGRNDVFIPARPVRDEKGRVIGCRALARI